MFEINNILMKKILFCISLCLLTVACNLEPEGVGNGEIEVSNSELLFPAKAFYDEVSITTDASWKIAIGAKWLSVSQTQGKGNETVTFVVEKNTEDFARSTQVKVYTKTSSQTITVTQFSPSGDDYIPDAQIEPGNVTIENGAIKAAFSIGENKKAYFSQGNLQYQASTGIWRFAEKQWNVVGDEQFGSVYENGIKCDNTLISPTYSGWIDLFCWGTSGWNSGAKEYKPYSNSDDPNDYLLGETALNLTGEYAKADWGVYNKISNGGNKENMWRTPTIDEWDYLFFKRKNAENLYSRATVVGTKGVIVLPDNCTLPESVSFTLENQKPPSYDAVWLANTYNKTEWEALESYGAVFLPLGGGRIYNNLVDNVDAKWYVDDRAPFGYYWSSTAADYDVQCLIINTCNCVYTSPYAIRYTGHSVRLIQDIKQ